MGRLREAAVDLPALDAELLLAHILQCDTTALFAHPEWTLKAGQADQFRSLVQRRVLREPIAYILGHKEFYDFDLLVDHRVLIPRPETEELVELALSWIHRGSDAELVIADVGTGSGAVAIALAAHAQAVTIYAVDSSAAALDVAALNVRQHGLARRVHLLAGNLLAPVSGPIDLVVGNLPYVGAGEIDSLMPEVSEHEPRMALDGGEDGLHLVRTLLEQSLTRLRAGGAIMLEIGSGQGARAAALAGAFYPDAGITIKRDLAGLDRILVVETSAHPSF